MYLLLQDHKMKRINYNTKKTTTNKYKKQMKRRMKKNEIKSCNSM